VANYTKRLRHISFQMPSMAVNQGLSRQVAALTAVLRRKKQGGGMGPNTALGAAVDSLSHACEMATAGGLVEAGALKALCSCLRSPSAAVVHACVVSLAHLCQGEPALDRSCLQIAGISI
jgi:hypothetical protein